MEFRYIGKTGLRVSSICMGTMTFGSTTNEKEAFKFLMLHMIEGLIFMIRLSFIL